MQGQTKKYYPEERRVEIFLRLAKRTLVSFGNQSCNFAAMFWCIWIESVSLPFCIFSKLSIDKDDEVSMKLDCCMVFPKKQNGCNALRTFCFFQARAVCEWSHRWQTWNTKNEYVGWLLLAARGWRGFCFLA